VGVVAPIAGAAAIYYYWPNKKDEIKMIAYTFDDYLFETS
jgi:hypothetical protein